MKLRRIIMEWPATNRVGVPMPPELAVLSDAHLDLGFEDWPDSQAARAASAAISHTGLRVPGRPYKLRDSGGKMKLRSILMETPGGKCPGCGADIDWHADWVAEHKLIYQGRAAIDCPLCGAAVLMPGYVNFSIAPDTVPVLRRSLTRAHKWAGGHVTPMKLDDYLQTPTGLPYKNYKFEP